MTPPAEAPRETHEHCWHQWGPASGSISSTGTTAKGTKRCCHCGAIEQYEYSTSWSEPPKHGPYYLKIESHPR